MDRRVADTASLFRLDGLRALVTGGTSGLGWMIAKGLLEAGASVIVCSRSETVCRDAEASLAASGDVIVHRADLSTEEGCLDLVARVGEHWDGLEVLVNNAGTQWGCPLEDFPDSGWDKVLAVNLKAPFFLTRSLRPLLARSATAERPSRIINIGSIDGLQVSGIENYSYTASKAGLHHMTRVLAYRLASDGILVNAIAPGPFETGIWPPGTDFSDENLRALSPLGRIGAEADIAGAVIFLSSAASSWITGVVLPVDGGITTTAGGRWT